MSVNSQTVTQLLNDENIQERAKLEDFIAVASGARKVSQLMVPADFPAADRIKSHIDEGFKTRYYHGKSHGGITALLDPIKYGLMRAFMNPLRYKASLLRESFHQVVFDHDNYKAHRRWADEMNLEIYETQIRPSLDEMYVARDEDGLQELIDFQKRREEIRREIVQQARQQGNMQVMLMPEERSPEYVSGLGRILGYPDCCIEAYIDDIQKSVDSALRASNELSDMDESAEDRSFNLHAYFASGFFPCAPDCENATQTGKEMQEKVTQIDERLSDYMLRTFRSNKDYVLKYPEIRKQRREQMMSKLGGMEDGVSRPR